MQNDATGNKALILFGHGAREPDWARPLLRVRDAVQAGNPHAAVACAYLEYLSPTLDDCADALIAAGAEELVVLPVFIAQGGHLKRELPEMIARLRARHLHCKIKLATAIGESDRVIAAMAEHAMETLKRATGE